MGIPTLPREEWTAHPHFPAHALLLGSHRNFRHINRVLVEEAEGGAPLPELHRLFVGWIAAMRSHERYEEGKLYPYLARRFDTALDDGPFADAIGGHEALHAAFDDVIDAFGTGARGAATDALAAHEAVLDAHLRQEEELVIPLLLALSPAEFHAYAAGSLPELLAALERRAP